MQSSFNKMGRVILAPFWSISENFRAPGAYRKFQDFQKIDKDFGYENLNKKELLIVKRIGW